MTWQRAVVIGASGGIGQALVQALEAGGTSVHAFSRSAPDADGRIDLADEASIVLAAQQVAAAGPPDLVLVASGMLHQPDLMPEKSWREMTHDGLAAYFSANAIGPAMVAKHFLPLLPRQGRAGFAALSARIGSISDNRLGGWYGYRASKAALNMLIRTAAIELSRSRPEAFCIGLHPGTVETGLSAPFQRNVSPDSLFTPARSARHLLDVLDRVGAAESGQCFAWDGQSITP